MKRFVRRTFYRLAHSLLLYGHHAKCIAIQEGFSPSRLFVVYNSLDYPSQRSFRKSLSGRDLSQIGEKFFPNRRVPMILCCCRLTKQRCAGIEQLFEAMEILSQGKNTNLVVVGQGSMAGELETSARSRGLSVAFIGGCYDEQSLAELFVLAKVTVLPSAIGLLAIHSMSYGTPVITHDTMSEHGPEWESIIPGETGDFFANGNAQHLAAILARWLKKADNESTSKRCVSIVERFYNPAFQRRCIERALHNLRADDLFWIRDAELYLQSTERDVEV